MEDMEIDISFEDVLKAVLETLCQIGTEVCNYINEANKPDVPDPEQPVEE